MCISACYTTWIWLYQLSNQEEKQLNKISTSNSQFLPFRSLYNHPTLHFWDLLHSQHVQFSFKLNPKLTRNTPGESFLFLSTQSIILTALGPLGTTAETALLSHFPVLLCRALATWLHFEKLPFPISKDFQLIHSNKMLSLDWVCIPLKIIFTIHAVTSTHYRTQLCPWIISAILLKTEGITEII